MEWAEVVVAFEARHRRRLAAEFGELLRGRRVVVLGVPDRYAYLDPALVDVLRQRLPGLLGVPPLP